MNNIQLKRIELSFNIFYKGYLIKEKYKERKI